jgi:hypothetical protein
MQFGEVGLNLPLHFIFKPSYSPHCINTNVNGKHFLTDLTPMKKSTIILLLTMTLASCDYFNETRVCNQTGKEIILKITFDSDKVKSWSGGMLVRNVTKTFSDWDDNLIPIDMDTINYISTYLIRPDSCGQVESGNNRRPNFHFYKEMEIVSGYDTLRLQTKEQMRKAFDADREHTSYYFDLLIQEGGKNASR